MLLQSTADTGWIHFKRRPLPPPRIRTEGDRSVTGAFIVRSATSSPPYSLLEIKLVCQMKRFLTLWRLGSYVALRLPYGGNFFFYRFISYT
ncbi:hypothetical protein NQZ68_031293 [Dissostichus eleginoides]|nr:hypothetical protein NQZ68_031293 [Dissostichus eleginoides]